MMRLNGRLAANAAKAVIDLAAQAGYDLFPNQFVLPAK